MVSHNQTQNDGQGIKPKQFRKFQVHKSTPLGLVQPQMLRLTLNEIDQYGIDLGPMYKTSNMEWWKAMGGLPPNFELFPAQDEKAWPVSKVKRLGWQSISSIRAEIEVFNLNEWMKFENVLPTDIRSKWHVSRVGLKRHYAMCCTHDNGTIDSQTKRFEWKGSMKAVELLNDDAPKCNGNLKLEDDSGRILAVWKQRRDWKILGSIIIFEDSRDVLSDETILASCLFVVLAERINNISMFGGIGKR